MTRLPFPDAGFDVVFAFSTLHHAGESHRDPGRLPSALTEIDRVLRPSGFLAYEEFLHKATLHSWLTEHRYTVAASWRGWRRELVVAQKPPSDPAAPFPSTR
jgi:ubiquinone/menaquinone biosynthesis C-methylase UbiE